MEPIGDHIRRELGRFGAEGTIADIVAAWPSAVGETVARSAWPSRVARDGTLHVATASSAWAYELAQLAPRVLESLRSALAERAPKTLRFAVGPLPESPTDDHYGTGGKRPAEPRPEERELAAALAAGVADSELRRLVARAAAAGLARAAHDRSV